ncbi:MAG: ABC transporter permease [Erysipelotrichaceae bacterium]|nr:ABC transporter permease [Erysipelotrichaceae bacterium]MDD3923924.1 ABC transporter permease [Erysipelotrichaceae bacterium]MDD4642699.1 ABC transporter permease [Erysipelotrichaceae bacterium]
MTWSRYLDLYAQPLFNQTLVHIYYVLISVTFGFLLGVIIGILLSRIPKYSKYILPILSLFNTIPGIVFIGLLFIYLGMKPITVIIALSIYAMFPVLKNTFVGIINVEEQYKEAARGSGMSNFQILYKVELPLAMSTIIGGLRLATIYTVSWSVLAAMIGLGGLGVFVYQGIEMNRDYLILTGAIPAAIMAISLSFFIEYIQKKVVPKGLQGLEGETK